MTCGDERLKVLSARILNSCENFVIAPRFWDSLADSEKESIRDFYISSLFADALDISRKDLMLFSRVC